MCELWKDGICGLCGFLDLDGWRFGVVEDRVGGWIEERDIGNASASREIFSGVMAISAVDVLWR